MKREENHGVSRRDFIKGAATSAIGLAALGVLDAYTVTANAAEQTAQEAGDVITLEMSQKKWSFEIPPEPVTSFSEERQAQIIVVGAGMAGLTTACSAAENGAEVILVSASSAPISRGGSNSATYSRVMEQYGVAPVDPVKFFEREYLAASYQVDQRKWSKFYTHSEEAMNWLIDKLEAQNITVTLERDNSDPLGPIFAHGFMAQDMEGSMVGSGQQSAVNTLELECLALGVKIYYNEVALQLVREEENTGRVSAVITEDADGNYIKYNGSKAIVLATGDFSANKEMVAKYCPQVVPMVGLEEIETDYNRGFSLSGIYKGDGQKMGLWVGAAWQKAFPNAPMMQGAWGGGHEPLGFHYGLVMDANGNRYAREDVSAPYSSNHLLSVPKFRSYAVWTANYATQLVENGHEWYSFGQTIEDSPRTPEAMVASWENGRYKADTLEGMAELFGIPADNLIKTVERYNELCNAGSDTDFFKNPDFMIPIDMNGPFYGSMNYAMFMTVMGGLRTDANMQVCDENDAPIPGLFNVGIMVGDMYANTYNFAIPGHSYGGNCLTFGYILGQDLANDAIAANL